MARKFSGKTTTVIVHVKQKNGVTYVCERKIRYDQKLKKTVILGERLIGKIMPGTTEIVPTRPKCKKGERKSRAGNAATCKRVGLTDILEWAGKESGVDADVRSCFGKGDAEKILSLVHYLVATNGQPLPEIEGWQFRHPIPYSGVITEDVYGDLFRHVGVDFDGIQRFFRSRADRLGPNPTIAYDSTTVSTYSGNLTEARFGFNKDGDGLKTVKHLLLYSVKDRQPIAFAKQPGNIPDVVSLENALKQLNCFSIDAPLVTTDAGYYSEANLVELFDRHYKFLTLVDTGIKRARLAIDTCREELERMNAVCPFDRQVTGVMKMQMQPFKKIRRRGRGDKAAGDEEIIERRVYSYVFKSMELQNTQESNFRDMLAELKRQVDDGLELTEAAQRKAEKYLKVNDEKGGEKRVEFNEEACAEKRKYFGYYVLFSNASMDKFAALENYRLREKIEETFGDLKNTVDGRRTRVWDSDTLHGRQFVQFVALCYRSFIVKRIKDLKETLGVAADGKSEFEIKREKQLKSWMEQRSLKQIFDWFDCIEETIVPIGEDHQKWITEKTARDKLFLELLGVKRRS